MVDNERFWQGYTMSAVSEIVDGRKRYRPNASGDTSSLAFGIFFLFVMLLVPFIGVFVEYRKTGQIGTGWIGLFIFIAILSIAAIVRGSRRPATIVLELSADGIAYQRDDRTITARWADVQKLRAGEEPELLVRASNDDAHTKRAKQTERISLVPFDYTDDSELAHDLRAYAPHLFQ